MVHLPYLVSWIFVHPAKLDKEAVSVLLTRISSIPELSHEPKSAVTNKNSNTGDTNTKICASNSITYYRTEPKVQSTNKPLYETYHCRLEYDLSMPSHRGQGMNLYVKFWCLFEHQALGDWRYGSRHSELRCHSEVAERSHTCCGMTALGSPLSGLLFKSTPAPYGLDQRFSNCGPRTTSGPRVLPLWSF